MTSCSPNTAPNDTAGEPLVGITLFDGSSVDNTSATFVVSNGPWVVQGFNLGSADCVSVEYAVGCGEGTLFAPVQQSCGCGVKLCQDNNTISLPLTGRYRLVANGSGVGDFTIIARPAPSSVLVGNNNMACGCNSVDPNSHAPATVTSVDGVIAVVANGQNFTLDYNPVVATSEVAASPAALAILCSALTPCITALTPAPVAGGVTITSPDSTIVVGGTTTAPTLSTDAVSVAADIASTPAAINALCPALAPCIVAGAVAAATVTVTDTFGVFQYHAFP